MIHESFDREREPDPGDRRERPTRWPASSGPRPLIESTPVARSAHPSPRAARTIAVLAVLLGCTLAAVIARAEPVSYTREKRIAHLAAAAASLRAMGQRRTAFELALHEGVRTRCRPGNKPAPTACMRDVARTECAKPGAPASCAAVADILLTNQHAERDLLDEPTRMRLVRESGDYHASVIAALEVRYALLAAELAIAAPDGDLATRIDRLCSERDRAAHPCPPAPGAPPACIGTIAYQRCAAGLVWYTSAGDAR